MNPWLEIPLEEYEGHMSSPSVAQARYLVEVLDGLVQSLSPSSVAVLGCAGGNGFEILSARNLRRVVGVDINPEYVAAVRARYHFPGLELYCCDLLSPSCVFEQVDFVFAGLIFEYVDLFESLRRANEFLVPGGYLGAVLQLPSARLPHVTPSSFKSLEKLDGFMRLVPKMDFQNYAKSAGFILRSEKDRTLKTGKSFYEAVFQRNKK